MEKEDIITEQVLSPRDSGEYIVKNADYISVHEEGIVRLANEIFESIKSGKLRSENFSQNNGDLHPSKSDPKAVEWIFILDTLNFCFWTPGKRHVYKLQFTGVKFLF